MTNQRYVLVSVETAHIQSYIFASNRLKENVGASYLVAAATSEWPLEILDWMGIRSNLTFNKANPFDNQRIEDGNLDVEVLYSGGGNIVLLFAETGFVFDEFRENRLPENALSRQFIRYLSRRVHEQAPGLKLTFGAVPFSWETSLSEAVGSLLQKKLQRSYQPALRGDAGLGIQIMDVSTSLPAVEMRKESNASDENWQPCAPETVAKREIAETANALLHSSLALEDTDYRFTLDIDDLGRSKEETSYIAVVHADGNGLGLLIQGLKEKFPRGKNRDYINHMRVFSETVKQVTVACQRTMVAHLVEAIEVHDGNHYLVGIGSPTASVPLKQRGNQTILPLRPLVSGGDDVTFVCDGRIGLDLAVIFLKAFEHYTAAMLNKQLTACAGIAIVKTHYPFARAYDLADELAGNAKQASYLQNEETPPSSIDWHVTAGGIYDDLSAMRKREYEVQDGSLTLRPIFVTDLPLNHEKYLHSWPVLQRIITEFQIRWRGHRNKAEGLRDILRKGPLETNIYKARYLTSSGRDLSPGNPPYLPEVGGFEKDGWKNGCCGYYDALELMDKYIPLQTQEVILL